MRLCDWCRYDGVTVREGGGGDAGSLYYHMFNNECSAHKTRGISGNLRHGQVVLHRCTTQHTRPSLSFSLISPSLSLSTVDSTVPRRNAPEFSIYNTNLFKLWWSYTIVEIVSLLNFNLYSLNLTEFNEMLVLYIFEQAVVNGITLWVVVWVGEGEGKEYFKSS